MVTNPLENSAVRNSNQVLKFATPVEFKCATTGPVGPDGVKYVKLYRKLYHHPRPGS